MVMDNKKYEAAKTLLRADLRLWKEPQEGDVARLLLAAPGHRRRGLAGDWPHTSCISLSTFTILQRTLKLRVALKLNPI